MCAQVCADTLRDGAAAEGTPREAHPQGLFWNLLSKSPTGAVGIGSSPLGEPVQPLDYFSQLALSIIVETLQPPLGGLPSRTGLLFRGAGHCPETQPGSADFLCQSQAGRAAVGSMPRLDVELWPLCTHLGWGHSPFTQASKTSMRVRCPCTFSVSSSPTGL